MVIQELYENSSRRKCRSIRQSKDAYNRFVRKTVSIFVDVSDWVVFHTFLIIRLFLFLFFLEDSHGKKVKKLEKKLYKKIQKYAKEGLLPKWEKESPQKLLTKQWELAVSGKVKD